MEESPIIGTLNEQTLHLALKNYIDPNPTHHEIKYLGAVADIINENGIFEIETRSFSRLKKKIERFITEKNVTVVFPIAEKTQVQIVDENGNVVKNYKSPKKGDEKEFLYQLFLLPKDAILSGKLSFCLAYMDVIQYRAIVGRGKRIRTKKIDRIPMSINSVANVNGREKLLDFCKIPEGDFSASEFATLNKINSRQAWTILKLFENLELLCCDKSGRKFIYRLV